MLLSAQELTFQKLPAGAAAPTGRVDGAIAYDARSKQVYLFGGRDNSTRNDIWVYSLERREWNELRPSGSAPPARFGHTLIFDPVRRRVILFGGQAGGFFSDTWAYDVERNAWQQLARDDAGPSRRYGHSGIYDPARDRMIISHGFTDSGRFDDTWAFDLARNAWQNISPQQNRPLRRCLHHAVLDEAGNQMLLYGGCASGFGPCPLGDLWSFDLSTNQWTERTGGDKPPARQWYGGGFDTARRKLVLFGGSTDRGTLNDVWEYDPAANRWRTVTVADVPPPRQRHEAVYVPDAGIAFFGGSTNTGLTNDLLLLGPAASPAGPRLTSSGIVNAFSGQGGPVAPGEIVSLFGSGLGPETGVSNRFDAAGELPRGAAGVTVTFNGTPAPIYYAQTGQINVQVPYEVANAVEAVVVVNSGDANTPAVRIPVAATSPGLHPSIYRANGSKITAENRPAAEEVIVLFATGYGATNPAITTGVPPRNGFPAPVAPVRLQVNERDAEIQFVGLAPETVGVLQINAALPSGVAPAGARIALRIGERETSITLP